MLKYIDLLLILFLCSYLSYKLKFNGLILYNLILINNI